MTFADQFKCLEKFPEQVKLLKTVLSHVGLYVGLIIYTALGAWIFQMLEFPVEEEKMTTLLDLVVTERENFINLIFNLTSKLTEDELGILETYIQHGPDFDSLDYDIRTIMLNTNRLVIPPVPHGGFSQMTNNAIVDNVINRVDEALLDYENVVAVASSEGIDMTNKEINYQWTYVQSVFFTSTIITTVGKQKRTLNS
jgi:hypothetical protein